MPDDGQRGTNRHARSARARRRRNAKTPSPPKAQLRAFRWDDPLLLDEQLTDDERMIRDTARAYAQDEAACRA